jgi:hypothetical protein
MSDSVNLVAALGGELVTYQPYGGVAKTFRALVERQPSQVALLTGVAYPEHSLLVTFPKDATNGVTAITKGKDKIKFKRTLSESQETEFTVVVIDKEDAGLVAGDGGMFTVVVK